ncbi:MAG: 50S ribosomal protein L11 methyltransferase [Myxococcales bacterium]|nr:50S ribosomal protein L11 methyltransferase [Myxococcales bacterium]MCB9731036.1 50S ribosomal protein L11 methyltransferase [Deltaproteobacteria bacterium]
MVEWQLAIGDIADGYDAIAELLALRGAQIDSARGDATLIATFTDPPDLIIIDAVGAWLSNLDLPHATVQTRLAEGDPWLEGWRAIFAPFQVSERLWVAPDWAETPPDGPERVTVVIDPSQAFGAGGHPTTRAVLGLLETAIGATGVEAPTVLDVGSGTGILAIAAAKLGATGVGVEIDRQACEDSVENARLNGVADRFEVHVGSMEHVHDRYDLVLANIYDSLLVRLAPDIQRAAKGDIVLSGIMTPRVAKVEAAYPDHVVAERHDDRDWTTLWLRPRAR